MIPHHDKAVFDLPNGPKNLAPLFPGIDWSQVAEYETLLKDGDTVLVTSTMNVLSCSCEDDIRICFENRLGRWDYINFSRVGIVHSSESSEYKKSLPLVHDIMETGIERFNVRSNETFEAISFCYTEQDLAWCMELADTAKAFMVFNSSEGQADTFLPIVVLDGKRDQKKIQDEFSTAFTIQFKMANENNLIRN
jgi:hypothetical protein